jgi:hypothetical protein
MFGVIGIILTTYGLIHSSDAAQLQRSLGININLWWGLFIIAFSAIMLFLSLRAKRK